MSEDY